MRIFIVFFFITLSVHSQNLDRNAIINEYQNINTYKSLETKQDSIYKLSRKILRLNSVKALSLYTTLDSLITADRLKLAYLMGWGTSEFRFGNINRSKSLRQKGLEIAKKYNDVGYMFDYTDSMTSFYINTQQADSATYYNEECQKLIQLHPKRLTKFRYSIYLSDYYIQGILGNEELVDKSIEKSWLELSKFPKHKNYGFVLYIITDHFRKRKNYAKQAQYAELLIDYYNKKKVNTPDTHFPVETVLYKKDSPEAINQLKHVVEASDKTNSLNTFSYTSSGLARLYLDKNEPENAIHVLERAIFKLDSAKNPQYQSVKYELLQKAYIQKNNYKVAYHMLGVQKKIEDSLRSDKQLAKVADYEVKYQTQEKERQLEKKEADQKLLFWILGFGVFMLLSLSYFFIRNKKQNKKLEKQTILLNKSLDEKNILLREVHHRVKNSFQIVSSLLYLQSENVSDEKAKLAIKEAENRVRSMVLVHQKLYNKEELVGIDSKEYISDLVKDIFESHDLSKEPILYNLNIEPIVLDIETITPLGLILNELIINIMKHAFDDIEKDNTIDVNFSKINNELVLKVVDNGKGFEGNIKQTSFGITLMKALSKQLKATLNYDSKLKEGTQAVLIISKFKIL